MPIYEFASEDGEKILVEMDTKQPAEAYRVQKQNGKTYKRVYSVPNMSIDSRGGTSQSDFNRMTTNKKNLTVGQMEQLAKEMSEKRAEKEGVDPVKEQFYRGYEKQMGVKHINEVKRKKDEARKDRLKKSQKKLNEMGVKVTL